VFECTYLCGLEQSGSLWFMKFDQNTDMSNLWNPGINRKSCVHVIVFVVCFTTIPIQLYTITPTSVEVLTPRQNVLKRLDDWWNLWWWYEKMMKSHSLHMILKRWWTLDTEFSVTTVFEHPDSSSGCNLSGHIELPPQSFHWSFFLVQVEHSNFSFQFLLELGIKTKTQFPVIPIGQDTPTCFFRSE
jgi:hypothetical protein